MSHKIPVETLNFLQSYLGIKATKETILSRASELQEKLLKIHSYRCIKEFRFLTPRVSQHPQFGSMVSSLKGKKILDLGCCMGTDARFLTTKGADPNLILGVDQYQDFIDLGLDFYGDAQLLKGSFLAADFFASNFNEKLKSKNPQLLFDIIYTGSIFHLLSEELCKKLVEIVYRLLSDDGIFFGRMGGKDPAGVTRNESDTFLRFLHSPESFNKLLVGAGFKSVTIGWHGSDKDIELRMICFYAKKK